jgi:hypothetical protein
MISHPLNVSINTFSTLPSLWKTLIIIGFITVFIMLMLMCVIIILMCTTPKIDMTTNLDEYSELLEEFDKENTIEEKYPNLPKIKDLNGNIMKDLMSIEIL